MEKKSSKQIKVNLTEPQNQQKYDFFILKELSQIQKSLFSPNIYLWIDQNIHNKENQQVLTLLNKNQINPILCSTVEHAQQSLTKNPKDRFRIISSAAFGEQTCKQFNSNQQVIHIYIFCGNETAGQALQQKWSKIKFYTVDVKQFLIKIKDQSKYDNRFSQLPTFMKITTKDNTHDNTLINKSRYNLHGLFLFQNRMQAKLDFLKLAKYFYQDKNKTQLQQFLKEYPVTYNHQLALNWYTKQTFFYKLLNNFLRSSSNPLETPYLRLPFDATFKAIKQIYDLGNEKKNMIVYRGGFMSDNQLEYLQKNVGQYIEMFGFMSTSTSIDVAKGFIKNYHGNSLITVLIEDQLRQKKIDYGYANITKYSEFKQDQVLFNALNVFSVVSHKKQNNIHHITLRYGELARMGKVDKKKLQQKQKNILINYKYQQEIIQKFINQGNVFHYCQMYDNEVKYRQKHIGENKHQENIYFAKQLYETGLVYEQKDKYDKALEYYKRSLKIMKSIQGENQNTASIQQHIGNIYQNIAQNDKALQYYQRSLKIIKHIFGQNHQKFASLLQNIGIAYQSKAQYNKALQYYQKSLNITLNISGDNCSSIAITLNNIGLVYQQKLEYDKAIQYLQRSLKVNLNIEGENHHSNADMLHNIGLIYYRKDQFDKALQYYQRALKITINILGELHSKTSLTLSNIGNVYSGKGEYDKALQYYQRSLKIDLNIYGGKNHSNTATTLVNIGIIYQQKADLKKALQYFQRSLKISMNIFEENHSSNADTLFTIGNLYYSKAEYNKALQYYQRSLKINIKIFRENHINTAASLHSIGNIYLIKSENNKALQYYQRSLKITKNIFGEENYHNSNLLVNIGNVYVYKSEYSKASQYFQKSLKMKINKFGENHINTAQTLNDIGQSYFNQKKFQDAYSYFIRCYQIRNNILGMYHTLTMNAMFKIMQCKKFRN